MERSLYQQYGIQKNGKALWDQLKEDYKFKVEVNVWALQDEMSVVKLTDCKNVRKYTLKIQEYVNDFSLPAKSSTGMMPKGEHNYHLVQSIPKDNDWRFFTGLMYDNFDSLADKPEKIVTEMTVHKARLQQEYNSVVAAIFSKPQTKSEKRNSNHSRMS